MVTSTNTTTSAKKTPVLVERNTLLWASALATAVGAALGYGAKSYLDKRNESKASHNAHDGGAALSLPEGHTMFAVPNEHVSEMRRV